MHQAAVPSPAAAVHSPIVVADDGDDDECHHIYSRNNLDRPVAAAAASFHKATKAQKKGHNHKENQEGGLYFQDVVGAAAGFVGRAHGVAVEPAGLDRVADTELKTQGVHYYCASTCADQKAATTITVRARAQAEART